MLAYSNDNEGVDLSNSVTISFLILEVLGDARAEGE
jgi:hypothetical protein